MTASEQTQREIEAFFDSYRSAFERSDLEDILRHYAFPNHFVSDADVVALMPITTADDCRGGVERVLAWHREIAMESGQMVEFQITELSPRLAFVYLNIELRDARKNRLYDYQGVYTLVKADERWRVAAIAHNQIPRLRKCVARKHAAAGR